jgi:hypothetical protein
MKWFKHQSTARNDEKIALLEDLAGLEGYGFYFKVLEIIAESMDDSSKNHAEYSVSMWSKKVNVLPAKFKKLALACAEVGVFLVENNTKNEQKESKNIAKREQKQSKNRSETYKITSPNILKFRDNYTKNLQVASKQEEEEEEDKEREVKETAKAVAIAPAISPALPDEKKPAKSITPTELALLLALGIDRQLSIDFLTLRKVKKAPLTQKALEGLTREAGKAGISLDDAIGICIDRSWTGFNASWNWQTKTSQFGQGKGEKQISNLHDAYHAFTQCDMPSQAGIRHEN